MTRNSTWNATLTAKVDGKVSTYTATVRAPDSNTADVFVRAKAATEGMQIFSLKIEMVAQG
jgi:hypothetical protein